MRFGGVVVYFKCVNWDEVCTEEDINEMLHWNEGRNRDVRRVLEICTNSNPTFIGIVSLNLENHLLPTFQKCLCVFYTSRLISERLILSLKPLAPFKTKDQTERASTTAVPQ